MEKKSWIGYDVSINGGGLVALVPGEDRYSFQMDSIEYKGLDLPQSGPKDPSPDVSIITGLISAVIPVATRDDVGELAPDRVKKFISSSMMDLLTLSQDELESNVHTYDLTMPDIGPGQFQIKVVPVRYDWVDDTGWVISTKCGF